MSNLGIKRKKGFQKGNKDWDNPSSKETQFKKGMKPWNFGMSGEHNAESNYSSVHQWLKRHFGKSTKCVQEKCKRLSNTFEWCLIEGKKYEKKRENFTEMCKPCHIEYDNVTEKMWITRKLRYGNGFKER